MQFNQAKNLLNSTFNNKFLKDNFINFCKNLFKDLNVKSFVYIEGTIPKISKNKITKLERIGIYETNKEKIHILTVEIDENLSIEKSRSAQRNLVAWYMHSQNPGNCDACFVAFYSKQTHEWRLSFIEISYEFQKEKGVVSVKEELSSAKRWSFLLGPDESSHTAQSSFVNILLDDKIKPNLEEIKNCFNIEKVTDEFYDKYKDLFIRLTIEVRKLVSSRKELKKDFQSKNINEVDFSKKLLGQIIFLYFIQKKGWLGVKRNKKWGEGSKNFLKDLFDKKFTDYKNFFNEVLEPLFYEGLRLDRTHDDNYFSLLDCKIPFLNGGLFYPINDYDWVNTSILINNEVFSNQKKDKDGNIGDGVLDVFNRYNFTVKENEPLENEVAIDPEFLGKIFEKLNSIRSENFDEFRLIVEKKDKKEESKFNKKYGVFYTPREIVYYMCKESLLIYLSEKLQDKIQHQDLEKFIYSGEIFKENEEIIKDFGKETSTYNYKLSESIREYASQINDYLSEIKICDPSVGSGAFPVSIMNEIVKLRNLAITYTNKKQLKNYDLKYQCITNNIYGVDIDDGAVEISKLRLWLSLVVDEDNIKNINPLPNLDFKIVHGDSLLSIERNIFNNEILNTFQDLKNKFIKENKPNVIKKYKDDIKKILDDIFIGKIKFDFNILFSEVFEKNKGFDLVISNPPYIQLQRNGGELSKRYESFNFKTFNKTADIYCLFYEKGVEILNPTGCLNYITSNKWLKTGYGEDLRNYLKTKNIHKIIDFEGNPIFENASVDTNILLVSNYNQKKDIELLYAGKDYDFKKNNLKDLFSESSYKIKKFSGNSWSIGSFNQDSLKDNIESKGKILKFYLKDNYENVDLYSGIKTGCNDAFIIDEKTKDRLVNLNKKNLDIIKPVIGGADINSYSYQFNKEYILVTDYELDIKNLYPDIYNYLKDIGDKIDKNQIKVKGKGLFNRDDQGKDWWNLRPCNYYNFFEKSKIIWSDISPRPCFTIDTNKIYLKNTCFMIPVDDYFLVSILNSKVINFYLPLIANILPGGKGIRFIPQYIEILPIPIINEKNIHIKIEIEKISKKIHNMKIKNNKSNCDDLINEIDELVYKLYDINSVKRKVIEDKVSIY